MTTGQKKLFCFGFGYTCDYLAYDLQDHAPSWRFAGTTRDHLKQKTMESRGITPHIFDKDQPLADPTEFLKDTTHIVISTPPDDDGDPAFLAHADDILSIPTLEWVGYLSTTGVYGDRGGEWVTEESEIRPSSKRGTRRAKAEEQWLSLAKKAEFPIHLFRLSGIYGPGRSALDSVRAGVARRIDKPGHAFGRIHVEDIVGVLRASMDNPSSGEIYNVSDNLPAPSHEVISYACQLLGRAEPPLIPFAEADLAPITRSFYSDNKRVDNSKIKNNLGVTLKYPDYKAGLKACYDAEEHALAFFKNLDNKNA